MLSDSCFFSPWCLWLSRILLSSFHGMISSFHGMIPSYHDMISSYHAVFGLRHRDKAAKVIGLSRQTRGKRFHYKRLFTANVYDGGCKRLRWRMQTFAMADANVCDGGCKRLRERMQTFAVKRGSALQGRMQCTAGAVAVHCGSGCSALRGRLQCTASETGKTDTEIASPIQDKRTGRRDASFGLLQPSMRFLPSPDFRR